MTATAVTTTPPAREPDMKNGLRLVGELLTFMQRLDERVEALALEVANLRAGAADDAVSR